MIFGGEKVTGRKSVCFDFVYIFCLKNYSFLEELKEILPYMYSDTSANEDNSFRNHIR